jgi:hypothetical protein
MQSIYYSVIWYLWRRRVVAQWINRMESARKLFPAGYGWSTMRATSDVLASVQQKLVFYVSATGSKRTEETNAVRRYEEQLIEILESQIVASDFIPSEAVEAAEMLAEYESVQSDRCKTIVKALRFRK